MAAIPSAAPGSARRRAVLLFTAFSVVVLLISVMPLVLSPPVRLALAGPSLAPVETDVEFTGRLTLAGFGIAGATVDVMLDGAPYGQTTTGTDGSFTATVRIPDPGTHTLTALAAPGRALEARTGDLRFTAVRTPAAPTQLVATQAADVATLTWIPAASPDDAPVQEQRVYRQLAGAPWELVATLPGDASRHDTAHAAGARYAVASANVAGESVWARAATT